MSVKQHLGCKGLATDPNMLAEQGPGYQSIARECVGRREGYLDPRPGFGIESGDPSPLADLLALIPFKGDVLHVGSDTDDGLGGDPYNAYWPTAEEVVRDGNAAALQWLPNARRGVEARGNLYLTTADGVRRLETAEDTDALLAGILPPLLVLAQEGGTAGLMATNETAAYRAIFEMKLAGGLVVKSAPSGRVVYVNDNVAARNPEIDVVGTVPDVPGAVVTLKIYRSYITTSSTPPDEMFLMHAVEVPAGALSETIEDLIPNPFLGEALYTNTKQETIQRMNVRPPACKDMALFERSLFFANITRHARVDLGWVEGGDLSTVDDGVGTRTYNGTRTNGSASITMASTVGLRPGMLLPDASSWGGTAPVFVRTVAAGSVTLSETWGGATDGAPVAITFADAIWVMPEGAVGTEVDAGWAYLASDAASMLQGLYEGMALPRVVASDIAFGIGLSEVSRREGTTYAAPTGPRGVLLEAYSTQQTLYLTATHGDAYTPPLPEWNNVVIVSVPPELTGMPEPRAIEPEHLPNYVGWSKADEPEHWTLRGLDSAGHNDSPIERIMAVRGCMWILKGADGDGLYKLTGAGEFSGWSIVKVDTDTRLLTPELLTSFRDIAYAWTPKGLVAISDGGPIPISRPIIGVSTETIERRTESDFEGAFAVTNHKAHELIFGLPSDEDDFAEVVYVYNVQTGVFTTWFHENPKEYCCATYADSLLLFGTTQDGWGRLERIDVNADESTLVTITAVDHDAKQITIAGGSGFNPAVGDSLLDSGGNEAFITDVTSATVFNVHDTTGFSTESVFAFESYESVIRWHPKTGDGAAALKRFAELIVHWDSREGITAWDLGLRSTIGGGNSGTQSYTLDPDYDLTIPADQRCMIKQQNALASRLEPTITIKQARSKWRLSGVTVVSASLSTRVSR